MLCFTENLNYTFQPTAQHYTEKKSYGGSAGKHLFDNAPRRMIIFVQQQGTDAPTLNSTLINNTGKISNYINEEMLQELYYKL